MLAGNVYFYKENEVVKKIDIADYDQMSEEEFLTEIIKLKATVVTLEGFSNNQQWEPSKTILYKEEK